MRWLNATRTFLLLLIGLILILFSYKVNLYKAEYSASKSLRMLSNVFLCIIKQRQLPGIDLSAKNLLFICSCNFYKI